jgi:hypothetical protein
LNRYRLTGRHHARRRQPAVCARWWLESSLPDSLPAAGSTFGKVISERFEFLEKSIHSEQGKYNGGQKLLFWALALRMALLLVSGIALFFAVSA